MNQRESLRGKSKKMISDLNVHQQNNGSINFGIFIVLWEYYSAIKRSELFAHPVTGTNLKNMLRTEAWHT